MPFDTAGRTNDVKASSSDVRIALARRACEEQEEPVDTIAERIQMLGGTSIAMAADVAETEHLRGDGK